LKRNHARFQISGSPELEIITGVRLLYNGHILAGISSLLITPGFWIGTRGTLGWIYRLVSACAAYSYACDPQVRV
jgi:hypothetical protein